MRAGTIVAFAGTVEQIPEGWVLCDGENGTPDLRDAFVRGAEAVGGTGGGEHSHDISTDSDHKHGSLSTGGAHAHSIASGSILQYHHTTSRFASAGGHAHTGDSDEAGEHDHTPSGVAVEPPFYAALFIMMEELSAQAVGQTAYEARIASVVVGQTVLWIAGRIEAVGQTVTRIAQEHLWLAETMGQTKMVVRTFAEAAAQTVLRVRLRWGRAWQTWARIWKRYVLPRLTPKKPRVRVLEEDEE